MKPWQTCFLSLCLVTVVTPPLAWAQDHTNPLALPAREALAEPDALSPIEQQIFTRTFQSDPEAVRLRRLEKFLTGEVQPGSLVVRRQALLALWRENALITPTPQSTPTPDKPSESIATEPINQDATDYPAVSALEQKVFKQTFAQEDITKRLERLEQTVFRQTYSELPMVDRVDQLSLKVNPESTLGREESLSASPWGKGLPNSGSELSASGPAIYSRISGLEEQVLGRSYGGELLSTRLNRLEQAMVGSPQGGSIDTRLDRLVSMYGRRTAQNQAPQVQPPQVYTPGPSQSLIGAGTGMNYSQDMLNALPPALRQQMEAQRVPSLNIQPRPAQPTGPMATQPNPALQKSLVLLEYQIFGHDYPAIPFSSRLDNLERQVFGRTYPLMPYNQRLSRLLMRSGGKQGASATQPTPNTLMMMPALSK